MTTQTVSSRMLSYATAQDIGQRADQEDRFLVQEIITSDGRPAVLALVADGIGGHNEGQIASQMARDRVPIHLAEAPATDQVGHALRSALEATGRDIYDASLADPDLREMGTTCTAVLVVDQHLYLAHVGDTRAYLLHDAGLQQLSIDHTWGEEAIRAGFPPEEIHRHPNRGLLKRFLGIEPTVEVDTRYRLGANGNSTGDTLTSPPSLTPGDVLMLCSDGVADVLDEPAILKALQVGKPAQAATTLVQMALDAGAADNVTAVVLKLAGGKTSSPWWWPIGR